MTRLTCLICGYKSYDLVTIQEHVVEHGYQLEDHRRVTRRPVATGYIWTMPDGRDWLQAATGSMRTGPRRRCSVTVLEALQNALELLESLSYKSGDIHDDLVLAIGRLRKYPQVASEVL